MYDYYNDLLENKTKYLDQRIKKTDLYQLSRGIYVNQGKIPCECSVCIPDLIIFKHKTMKDVGYNIKHQVFHKNVIKIQDNYCLTYKEIRQFNSKHKIVDLKINLEYILAERIIIEATKNNYGIILTASHLLASPTSDEYQDYAHILPIVVEDFHLIPYGDILYGCHDKTIQMFEDFYSGVNYSKK